MIYRIDATVVLEEKHCLHCPLRKDDGSDECILQDCSAFSAWEDQMECCPLVSEAKVERMEKENGKLLTDIQKIEVNTDYWADRGRLLETLIREQLQAMDNTPMADINHAGMEWHRRAKELIQGPPVSVRSTITAKLGVNYCPIECNDDCLNPDNVQCCRACPKLAVCPEPCDELNRIERRGKAGENPTETGKG